MYTLPITVNVDGKEYSIRNKADYRTILGVIDVCTDPELTQEERTLSAFIVFFDGLDTIEDIFYEFGTAELLEEALHQVMRFINLNDDDSTSTINKVKLIDWQQDENLIISAVNNVAKTEVRALEYLHWWTFISYYMSIGESALSNVVAIRHKIAKGKPLEKFEQEFKRENPQYFMWKRKIAEEHNLIDSIWNVGKEK